MDRRQTRGRIAIAAAALVIAAAGIGVAVAALRPDTRQSVPGAPADTYDLTFPADPIPVEGQPGHYTVWVKTSLPEGTLADIEYTDAEGGGGGCCTPVAEGLIEVPLLNNRCTEDGGQLKGSDVTIEVIVAPDPVVFLHGPPSPRPQIAQPDSVISILGTNFENVDGPDVELKGDFRELRASTQYQLPSDTCIKG